MEMNMRIALLGINYNQYTPKTYTAGTNDAPFRANDFFSFWNIAGVFSVLNYEI